jgi:hypothetical protein
MQIIDMLLRGAWNGLRGGIKPRRKTERPQAIAEPDAAIHLGRIVRSPMAPPPGPDAPTDLFLTTEEKRRHLYLLGSTGMGKTNLLLNLVRADIRQGRGVCLLDARGELVDRVLMILAAEYTPEELKERLVLIDLEQDAWSVGINPLQEQTADVHTRTRFIQQVMKQAWDIGVQTDQLLRNSLTALAGHPHQRYSLLELEPFLTVPEFRARVLQGVTDPALRRFFARYEEMKNQGSWAEPVLNKVSPWLARPVLKHLLAQKDTLSLKVLLDERPDRIVLVSLAVNTLYGDAELFGSLFTHMIVSAVMRKERRDRKGNEFCFYLDEFERFDGLDKTFEMMLSEGRKFGLCLCLSHQTTVQLEPRLRNLIRNIVGTQIFFSVGGGDAETLVGEIATDEPKAVLRNVLLNQKVGECIVVRKGHPYTRLKTRLLPDPKVGEKAVMGLRTAALQRWGKSTADIVQELAGREREIQGGKGAGSEATEAPSTLPTPSKPRTPRKPSQAEPQAPPPPQQVSATSPIPAAVESPPTAASPPAPVTPSLAITPPEIVMEVRDVPLTTPKPKRIRRKSNEPAS